MTISNKDKLALLQEVKRRKQLDVYKESFQKFAAEQINITTKDATAGFVNFTLNEAQIKIDDTIEAQRKETGKVRAIVLKARQQGISTYCSGRVFWKTYFTPLTKSVVLAHDSATSDALFNMSKNLIRNMPADMRPKLLKSNAKEILLGDDLETASGYRLYTAGNKEAGRGTTPTILHCSEVAFWQHDAEILAGLFQGVSTAAGTEIILESTANGAQGEFYRLWRDAVAGKNEYVPIFIPWFITSEYTAEAPEGFADLLTEKDEEYQEKYDLSLDQMYWRYLKIAESGSVKFQQEYPACAEEAFIVSGSNVFDMEKLNKLEPQPVAYIREFDEASGYFEDKREGSLQIWKPPKHNDLFVLAADVALGVGQDYSAAVVLNTDGEVCAMYRNNRVDPSLFGDVLFYMGRYFNNALLAVESNSMGIATLNRLQQMKYVNLYHQVKTANVSDEIGTRPGFRTTVLSKSVVIGHLKRAIEDEELWIPSIDMIQELKDYVQDENGKTNAVPGSHDDTVMSLAIAVEVIRTHRNRLDTQNVPWSQRSSTYQENTDSWI